MSWSTNYFMGPSHKFHLLFKHSPDSASHSNAMSLSKFPKHLVSKSWLLFHTRDSFLSQLQYNFTLKVTRKYILLKVTRKLLVMKQSGIFVCMYIPLYILKQWFSRWSQQKQYQKQLGTSRNAKSRDLLIGSSGAGSSIYRSMSPPGEVWEPLP